MGAFLGILIIWILSSPIYLPQILLETLGIYDVVHNNKDNFLAAFWVTTLILFFVIPLYLSSRREAKHIHRQLKRDAEKKIHDLIYKERVYLREFFLQQQHIIFLDIEDPIVMGLLQKSIIDYTIGEGYFNFKPLQIAEPFKTHITHNVVGLPDDLRTLSKEHMAKIQRERPKCVAMYKMLRENS